MEYFVFGFAFRISIEIAMPFREGTPQILHIHLLIDELYHHSSFNSCGRSTDGLYFNEVINKLNIG